MEYNESEVWNEIDRLCEEAPAFSIGQNLFHIVPTFANCDNVIDSQMWDMIQEYNLVQKFNFSMGELDNASADRVEGFTIIESELNNCRNFKK